MKEEIAKFYAAWIAMGLENFHEKGIVYRDLQPFNILVDGMGWVKLSDWGMQRLWKLKHDLLDKPQTPEIYSIIDYLDPEAIKTKTQTPASD